LNLLIDLGDEYPRVYELASIQLIVYNIVIGLETGQEGYDDHYKALAWLKSNTCIVERGRYVAWGDYLRVPIEDRDLLIQGVGRFMKFFANLTESEFCHGLEISQTKWICWSRKGIAFFGSWIGS
jgi:hypothetical protein